ncbi:MAG: acyl-CoA thioesterase domain-containing protein [Acidobacteriota bacterium]
MAFFNESLGLRPGGDDQTVLLDTRPEHQVAPETIHFAVLTTLAEVSAARAVAASAVPVEVNVSLLRRAVPGRLEGKGIVLKRGRTLAFTEGEVRQDGKLVAKAAITFAVL